MEIKTKTIEIPAKTATVTRYVAVDGEEFYDMMDCIRHEHRIEIENHRVIKSKINIEIIDVLDDCYQGTLYYLRDEEDFEFLINTCYRCILTIKEDFHKYGPGWYLYYEVDGGDGPDKQYLYNYDEYAKRLKEYVLSWIDDIQSKIDTANEGLE